MAKSVKIQGAGAKILATVTSPQWCGIVGSQFARMGEQMKAYVNMKDTHHATTMTPKILAVSRKVRPMKMPWSNTRIESFAVASAVVWRNEKA